MRLNVSDLSWETEDKEKIILCNNNRNSYYRDPIGGTVFIRKDYFDKYAKSHCIKYFAFAERLIPETGYADETSLHFEIKDGIHATTKFLEMFFENLLMNAGHELKNRYMHIDYENESATQSAISNGSKCKNCTLEELAIIQEIKNNPAITQRELASAVGKSERTVKTRTVEMQEKGLIIRENGKRNGKWKVLVEI